MRIIRPRADFIIVEDYFCAEQAAQWLDLITRKGTDPVRGFHHPYVKPNRFHKNPKYPVKKFMCLGLYWNPLDYSYYPKLPDMDAKPFPLPPQLINLCQEILRDFFPWKDYSPEAALVNFYTEDSSMGLHIDKDEEEKSAPVIGLSFGSSCRFFYEDEAGGLKDIKIPGNSIYIFGGSARQMRHGLGTIYAKSLSPGSESYLQNKERLNITIRQVFHQRDKT
jgi:DNA alkylation damage repair protein AlkB